MGLLWNCPCEEEAVKLISSTNGTKECASCLRDMTGIMMKVVLTLFNQAIKNYLAVPGLTLIKRQISDPSKHNDFADGNVKFDDNGRKFAKQVEKLGEKEKLLGMSNLSLCHSVFKSLVLETRKK